MSNPLMALSLRLLQAAIESLLAMLERKGPLGNHVSTANHAESRHLGQATLRPPVKSLE